MSHQHVHVWKEATPEQLSWRRRVGKWEPALAAAFLAWVARLHEAVTDAQVVAAIATRSPAGILDTLAAVAGLSPGLAPVMEEEAQTTIRQLERQLETEIRLRLDLRNPQFAIAAEREEARMVREVTAETRRAITNVITRAYELGQHPYTVAPQIRSTVGLTSRQANAVMNYAETVRKRGAAPERVADEAMRYAGRMRTRRAQTIARTETIRAATAGRVTAYQDAGAAGLFDVAAAELEWSAAPDACPICQELDGERTELGGDFGGLLPPAHPACRCSVFLVLD